MGWGATVTHLVTDVHGVSTSSMSSRVVSKAFYRIYADVHIYRIYADVHNTRWLMMRHPQVERLYKDLATARII